MIRARKECPEIGWGEFAVLRTNVPEVLGMRYDWRDTSLVTLHNFSNRQQTVHLKVGCARDGLLVEVFDGRHSRAHNDGTHRIAMSEYAWRWFRVGAADTTLFLSDLTPEKLTRDA
jgi:maltose alpha-D-glucosyltransferase/alpha-amylase